MASFMRVSVVSRGNGLGGKGSTATRTTPAVSHVSISPLASSRNSEIGPSAASRFAARYQRQYTGYTVFKNLVL